jgi:hypothetical protein
MKQCYIVAILCCLLAMTTTVTGSGQGGAGGGGPAGVGGGVGGSVGGVSGAGRSGSTAGSAGAPNSGSRGSRWGSTSPEPAHEAIAKGLALPLSTVLPTVSKVAPGQVLEVDLHQRENGEWHYEFLVLTKERRYYVVVVDARRNQVIQAGSR